MSAAAVVLALSIFVALAVWLSVSTWRRIARDHGPLRLLDAARGQGVTLPEPGSKAAICNGALAVRRCVLCTEHSRCDALLAARDWRALREICPNTGYIDRLQGDGRKAS